MRSAPRLALAVLVLLAVDAGLAWMVIQGCYTYLGLVWHGLAGEFLPGEGLARHARQFRALRYLQGAGWAVTALVFASWLYRIHLDLKALGRTGLRYSPRQAALSLFIPGFNLVRPFLAVRAIWAAGEPAFHAGTPPWVAWWWALLLAASGAEVVVAAAGDPLDLGGPMQALVLAQGFEIAAAVLGIVLVRRITQRQPAAAETDLRALG